MVCFQRLPLVVCGISHYCRRIAQDFAARVLLLFDQLTDQQKADAHFIVKLLCTGQGRQEMLDFINGQEPGALPVQLPHWEALPM